MRDVLTAAEQRIARVFDSFERIIVSVSGGKDSHVLWHLAAAEARRRGKCIEAFFLDQEAEYRGSIEVIEAIMRDPVAIPRWYQVPLRMTNATSHRALWLHAWGNGEDWMRERSAIAIAEAPGAPDRFYDFFPWFEGQCSDTAFLVGLRSRESLNRWRALKNNPGYQGIGWSTTAAGENNFRFYPLFDWASGDIWKYLADHEIRYNRIYDQMFLRGLPERSMRVSFLVHEQSYRSLITLQELEPDTHDALVRRLAGTHFAAIYADESIVSARKLPAHFETWREFRDHLLATTPAEFIARMKKRFLKQGDDEATCREHCRQLLINDYENNVPIRRMSSEKLRALWWDRL